MNKTQAVRFWKELRNSTEVGEVISRFKNQRGYASERTLGRYVSADKGFREGIPIEEPGVTGWKKEFLGKLETWWKEEFGGHPGGSTVSHGGSVQVLTLGSEADDTKRWIWEHLAEADKAIRAYREEMTAHIQRSQLLEEGFGTVDYPVIEYGPGERAIIERILRCDESLAALEHGFSDALEAGNVARARQLAPQLSLGLSNWIIP